MSLVGILVAAGLVAGVVWRRASRNRLPCPASLSWILKNPYTEAVAGTAAVLDRLRLAPGMRVLDVGCGPGRLTIPIAERVGPQGEVVALDVQEAMLARVRKAAAERGLENVRTVRGSAEAMPQGAGEFDRALLVAVLGEIPDRPAALASLHAALRSEGLLAVTELLPDPDYQTRASVQRLAEEAGFRLEASYGTWMAFTLLFRKAE